MNDYEKRLEEFRLHYSINYGVKLDDEVLFYYIRVNEMQVDIKKRLDESHADIKKQLDTMPRLVFKSGWDYFMFGMGKPALSCIFVSLAVSIAVLITPFARRGGNIYFKNGHPFLKLQVKDSSYYLPLKSDEEMCYRIPEK